MVSPSFLPPLSASGEGSGVRCFGTDGISPTLIKPHPGRYDGEPNALPPSPQRRGGGGEVIRSDTPRDSSAAPLNLTPADTMVSLTLFPPLRERRGAGGEVLNGRGGRTPSRRQGPRLTTSCERDGDLGALFRGAVGRQHHREVPQPVLARHGRLAALPNAAPKLPDHTPNAPAALR